MMSFQKLPNDYKEICSIDMQKDKKLSLTVSLLAVVIAALLVVPIAFLVPLSTLLSMEDGLAAYIIRIASLLALASAYTVLHELVHGIAMKLCGTRKVRYGFTGKYAFACSDDYYGKKAYLFIALAPVVLWGVVLAIITPLVPTEWFWVAHMIQVFNLSGAAGDLFVIAKFSRLPKDILVRDYGVSMTVFSRSSADSK